MHRLSIKQSNLLIFRSQVELSCAWWNKNDINIDISLKNVPHHIHRGITANNFTDEILRFHCKPHIDYHGRAVLVLEGQHFMNQG